MKTENNFAFIDSQNLNLAIRELGWRADFARLRIYLRENYGVTHAFLFMGYLRENKKMYEMLRSAGFHIIFKPVLRQPGRLVKGNCDAELVFITMLLYDMFDQAVFITGDGDFACVIDYLRRQDKLNMLLVPNKYRFSALFFPRNTTGVSPVDEDSSESFFPVLGWGHGC